jgi:predicted dithiol-disulfide oxidoreductase (DUF899 family)
MEKPNIVSREAWLLKRRELLNKEKELTKHRDEVARERRQLPWVKVTKPYAFEGPNGKVALADLFGGHGQLIVYHFMFGPDWKAGCPSCSFMSDHVQHAVTHLAQRDVAYVAVSRAPLDKLNAFKTRMGWTQPWFSSAGSDFNFDFNVSFTQATLDSGTAQYNYENKGFPSTEAPGLSVFVKDEASVVYHTYSTFARGLDMLIGTYHFLDLVPRGRDEASLSYSMAWVKLRDAYSGESPT